MSFKPDFSLPSFSFFKRLFSISLISAITLVSSSYPMLLFHPAILIPSFDSSSLAFLYDLLRIEVKQAGWQYTVLSYSFSNFKPVYCSMSSSDCCFLAHKHVSQETAKVFCRIFQFALIHTVKGFSAVNKTEVYIFMEYLYFHHDPTNVSNVISSSSASSKSRLCICNFSVHVLLKSNLMDFEHNLASMCNECNCMEVWTFFGIVLLCDWNKHWTFSILWPLLSFPNFLVYWVWHFHSIIF